MSSAEFDGPLSPPILAQLERKPVVVMDARRPVKLDLACGQHPAPGFVGVDNYAPNAIKVDLFKFPWPWADNSVDELRCSHFVEHLPMCFVKDDGTRDHVGAPNEDMFVRFFDEAWRIMKPGAKFEVIVPYLQSVRAFQDPTHRRFLSEANFMYLQAPFRQMNGLDHYGIKCDFQVMPNRLYANPYEQVKNPETQQQRAMNFWNTVSDIVVLLIKPVQGPPPSVLEPQQPR